MVPRLSAPVLFCSSLNATTLELPTRHSLSLRSHVPWSSPTFPSRWWGALGVRPALPRLAHVPRGRAVHQASHTLPMWDTPSPCETHPRKTPFQKLTIFYTVTKHSLIRKCGHHETAGTSRRLPEAPPPGLSRELPNVKNALLFLLKQL